MLKFARLAEEVDKFLSALDLQLRLDTHRTSIWDSSQDIRGDAR